MDNRTPHRMSGGLAVTLGELLSPAMPQVYELRKQADQRAGDRIRLRHSDGYTRELDRIRDVDIQVNRIGMLIVGARMKINADASGKIRSL